MSKEDQKWPKDVCKYWPIDQKLWKKIYLDDLKYSDLTKWFSSRKWSEYIWFEWVNPYPHFAVFKRVWNSVTVHDWGTHTFYVTDIIFFLFLTVTNVAKHWCDTHRLLTAICKVVTIDGNEYKVNNPDLTKG